MKVYHVWIFLNGQLVRVSQLSDGFETEAAAIKAAYELGHSYAVVLPVWDLTQAAAEVVTMSVPRSMNAKPKTPKAVNNKTTVENDTLQDSE